MVARGSELVRGGGEKETLSDRGNQNKKHTSKGANTAGHKKRKKKREEVSRTPGNKRKNSRGIGEKKRRN